MRDGTDITAAVEAHANTVLRVCSLYFHGRPERDDAFQETFLKYSLSTKEFAGEEHLKAWLIRVATNVCKDMIKRADAKTILLDEIDESATPKWQGETGSNERADKLNEALRKLDEDYRIALYLKYYEDYTAPDIARILDIPENTVYTRLARGREKLKEVLTHGER